MFRAHQSTAGATRNPETEDSGLTVSDHWLVFEIRLVLVHPHYSELMATRHSTDNVQKFQKIIFISAITNFIQAVYINLIVLCMLLFHIHKYG